MRASRWVVVLVVAASCGGAPAPAPAHLANHVEAPPPDAPPPGMTEAIAKLHQFKDEMCTCKDAACAQHVSDEMTRWAQAASRDATLDNVKPSEDQQRQMAAIVKDLADCMTKAMTVGTGSMAQPAPSPPASP